MVTSVGEVGLISAKSSSAFWVLLRRVSSSRLLCCSESVAQNEPPAADVYAQCLQLVAQVECRFFGGALDHQVARAAYVAGVVGGGVGFGRAYEPERDALR